MKVRVKIWDGTGHWDTEPNVVELEFGEVFEFDDQFYSFEVAGLADDGG